MRAFLLLALLSLPAFAQKVVILELDGDSKDKLRAQVEAAVRESGAVELISLKDYRAAAAKKKMTGAAAMTPVGVARAAKVITLDAAVGGEVAGGKYNVVIYDRAGEQLWTKSLKVTKGLLSDDFATKLARAIAAAAQQGAAKPQDDAGGGDAAQDVTTGLDLTQTDAAGNVGVVTDVSGRWKEPERDVDLDDPNRRKQAAPVAVPIFRVWAAGATTWRSQCLRPGVRTCKAYDAASPKPLGTIVNFNATVPYFGLSLNAELFPLARVNTGASKGVNALAQGLGVLVNLQYGVATILVKSATDQGEGAGQQVKSTDLGFSAQLAYRYHFEMGVSLGSQEAGPYSVKGASPVGWFGLRGGVATRSFTIDPTSTLELPSTQRGPHGVFGVDLALPVLPQLRFEFGFSLFLNARPGANEIRGFGNPTDPSEGVDVFGDPNVVGPTAVSFGLEAGVAGQIWGPIGYTVRWRMASYTDLYYGQGQKWTICDESQCGGVGEESYHSLIFGLTASY